MMERSEILAAMGQLKLFGMRAAFDEIITTAIKRSHKPQRVVGDLLTAEMAEKHASSIRYGQLAKHLGQLVEKLQRRMGTGKGSGPEVKAAGNTSEFLERHSSHLSKQQVKYSRPGKASSTSHKGQQGGAGCPSSGDGAWTNRKHFS